MKPVNPRRASSARKAATRGPVAERANQLRRAFAHLEIGRVNDGFAEQWQGGPAQFEQRFVRSFAFLEGIVAKFGDEFVNCLFVNLWFVLRRRGDVSKLNRSQCHGCGIPSGPGSGGSAACAGIAPINALGRGT